jgi:HlyD family secretion protein
MRLAENERFMSVPVVEDVLGNQPSRVWRQRLQWLLLGFTLVALVMLVGRFVNGGAPTRYATAAVGHDDLKATLEGSGVLQAAGSEAIGSDVAGQIGTVLVRQGEQVRKGQILAQLDPTPFQAEIDQASTLLITRQAALSAAQTKAAAARTKLEGYEKVRTESGGLAPSDREMALARDDLRETMKALHGALVETDAARASIEQNRAQLALAEIRAPVDGVVVTRPQPGQIVAPGRNQGVFQIAAPYSRLRLEIMMPRADANSLRVGAPAQIIPAGQPSQTVPATVAAMRAARSADASRFIMALDVANPDAALRPGMAATARINLGLRRNVLIVPEAALRFARASDAARGLDGVKGDGVYVLGEGNTPRRMAVKLQGGNGARRAVTSDELEPNMPVITGLR